MCKQLGAANQSPVCLANEPITRSTLYPWPSPNTGQAFSAATGPWKQQSKLAWCSCRADGRGERATSIWRGTPPGAGTLDVSVTRYVRRDGARDVRSANGFAWNASTACGRRTGQRANSKRPSGKFEFEFEIDRGSMPRSGLFCTRGRRNWPRLLLKIKKRRNRPTHFPSRHPYFRLSPCRQQSFCPTSVSRAGDGEIDPIFFFGLDWAKTDLYSYYNNTTQQSNLGAFGCGTDRTWTSSDVFFHLG